MNKKLAKALNEYLANIGVEYVKLHNLHWNVVGKEFKAVHEYLETLYDAMADVLDETAEILRMSNELPLASMADYLKVASIKELASKEYSVDKVISFVLADMNTLLELALKVRSEADKSGEFNIVASMEDDIKNYKKTIWFLSVMQK